MTAPTEQFVDIAKQSQEAVTTAVRTWADTMQSFAGGLAGGQPTLPDAHSLVDHWFDFAEQVLANHRRFTQTWVAVCVQVVETMTTQAARATESVTAQVTNATESVAQATEKVGDAAGDGAASNARAARAAAAN